MQRLTKERFDALIVSSRSPWTRIAGIEKDWYSDEGEKVLCVIVQDTTDKDYTCIVLGRDRIGRFRAVHLTDFFKTLKVARAAVADLLSDWASRDASEYEQGDEPKKRMDFFTPLHAAEKLSAGFSSLISDERFSPARGIVESMMSYFKDPDGNFVEQFQSSAFNARLWELYLFAVLAEERCQIDRTHPAPDYLFTSVYGECFLEAVTANPTAAGEMGYPEDPATLADYLNDYLPTKFSGPLVGKLEKEYWKKPYIGNRPIIFAIADFHWPDSMSRSQESLVTYLYGQRFKGTRDEPGGTRISLGPVAEHIWKGKRVPSGFFSLSGSENISAVISTGEETITKFNRMGFRAGFGSERLTMNVSGWKYTEDAPEQFDLNILSPEYEELWVDGLHVYHNPLALLPLDTRLFGDATHHKWMNGGLGTICAEGAPFGMETRIEIITP